MSDAHKNRFSEEHAAFVNGSFEQYYAIDRFGSFTDPMQFQRFCAHLNIPCVRVEQHDLFNFNRLEALFLTRETTFDPVLLAAYYHERILEHSRITLLTETHPIHASAGSDRWEVRFRHRGEEKTIEALRVINATYAATNSVNQLFGLKPIDLSHEISEIAFLSSRVFKNKGLTVMDGPFGSIMPYGDTDLLSLSSVAYTHHKISYDNLPSFDCQDLARDYCNPEHPGVCTDCLARPVSNAGKMLAQMRHYLNESVDLCYWFSYFTIKSKLKANHIDDGRPTEISRLKQNPAFYCLFAGKINSIYEVEKIV
jgi:hypothetical protein